MTTKKTITILFILFSTLEGKSQKIITNYFIRMANVANFNLTNKSTYYTPALATGFGFSHKSKFIEIASFVNKDDNLGLFTFFGSTLHTKTLDENWKLHTNWFGETTYFPEQKNNQSVWINTVGMCFFLNRSYKWGSIGIPLCVGGAYSERTISINTRAILNLSFDLNK
ncbi:MAG: hypothetical protein LCH67_03280 [Bacteroidetes bacterium]|nr:hypothetical protein [Bacteroidota bacterium]